MTVKSVVSDWPHPIPYTTTFHARINAKCAIHTKISQLNFIFTFAMPLGWQNIETSQSKKFLQMNLTYSQKTATSNQYRTLISNRSFFEQKVNFS